mmetsp:Transcript_31965/g.95456  ORF Transcript_31965/g.95456 Transcript_31965/m.95456 type:complete len:380 (+) Transcript_31965:740-1879(+)
MRGSSSVDDATSFGVGRCYCTTCCHTPSVASRHIDTPWAPTVTVKMLPADDQLTRHTADGLKSCTKRRSQPALCVASAVPLTAATAARSLHTNTCPSCAPLAIVDFGRPGLGAHATSRTQSVWPCSTSPSDHCPHTPHRHVRTMLSQPALASALTGCPGAVLDNKAPGGTAGAHVTDVTPTACIPGSLVTFHVVSAGAYSSTETVPSEEPAASASPTSGGAHATLFTDDEWRPGGVMYTCCHKLSDASRHTMTLPSWPADASSVPHFGCAHPTCHTGPWCPTRSATCACCSPLDTSNTLTVPSEEQVARWRPWWSSCASLMASAWPGSNVPPDVPAVISPGSRCAQRPRRRVCNGPLAARVHANGWRAAGLLAARRMAF